MTGSGTHAERSGVQATEIACGHDGAILLSGISFKLEPGDGLLVRGPNGVGKSTLLECLADIRPLLAGWVKIDREQVAYCGHLPALKGELTARENLEFWHGLFGVSTAAAHLEVLDIQELSTRPAGLLSAGQRTRLSLATMITLGRAIWLLDEPYALLDEETRNRLDERMLEHRANGGTVVMTTNDRRQTKDWLDLDLNQFVPAARTRPGTGA